jgi:hypothetical protein
VAGSCRYIFIFKNNRQKYRIFTHNDRLSGQTFHSANRSQAALCYDEKTRHLPDTEL